jgi:hypothetical protein
MQKYPLDWPQGYNRYGVYRVGRPLFKTATLFEACKRLKDEVRRLQGKSTRYEVDLIISSNVPLTKNGDPRADYLRSKISDPGVAVYFKHNGQAVVLCCDKYIAVEDNIKAIAITIEDMRRIERNGVSDFIRRSFTGFKALGVGSSAARDWWQWFNFDERPAPTYKNFTSVQSSYRDQAKALHPDTTPGNGKEFAELGAAWAQAEKYFKEN